MLRDGEFYFQQIKWSGKNVKGRNRISPLRYAPVEMTNLCEELRLTALEAF